MAVAVGDLFLFVEYAIKSFVEQAQRGGKCDNR